MIPPLELKVNNKVYLNGIVVTLTSVSTDGVYFYKNEEGAGVSNMRDFKGIALTPEVLLDYCGFEYSEDVKEGIYLKSIYYLPRVYRGLEDYSVHFVSWKTGKTEQTAVEYFLGEEQQHVNNTEYLHNLQNAFQLANGYEMKVKL